MSKFEELRKAAWGFLHEYSETATFLAALSKALVSYLNWPEDCYSFYGLLGSDKVRSAKPEGAVHLRGDTLWHLGLELTVPAEEQDGYSDNLPVELMAKKSDGSYLVRVRIGTLLLAKDWRVSATNQADLGAKQFCADVFDALLGIYEDGSKRMEIGFNQRSHGIEVPHE